MRWLAHPRVRVRIGDCRVVLRFAWRPTVVQHLVFWLERYESHQTFEHPGIWVETRRTIPVHY